MALHLEILAHATSQAFRALLVLGLQVDIGNLRIIGMGILFAKLDPPEGEIVALNGIASVPTYEAESADVLVRVKKTGDGPVHLAWCKFQLNTLTEQLTSIGSMLKAP
jgi:hypothetical protein